MLKKTVIFFFSFFMILPAFAGLPSLPRHIRSELIDKDSEPCPGSAFYVYGSPLDKNDLVGFYREMLNRQGWKLQSEYGGSLYVFEKGNFLLVFNFIRSYTQYNTTYKVSLSDISVDSSKGFLP